MTGEKIGKKIVSEFGEAALVKLIQWYSGYYMSNPEHDQLKEIFGAIGQAYGGNPKFDKLYRCVHLRDNSSKVGDKPILSWSSTLDAANFFFDFFVCGVNHRQQPVAHKKWAIISSNDPVGLVTHAQTVEFMNECVKNNYFSLDKYDLKNAEKKIVSFSDMDMKKLHEVICDTPKSVKFTIEKVLVDDYKMAA